ncbi:reverse transcriptase SR3-left [Elysia marginata]|uniref:Reverse transcriptase SR3-left n=1 Tax=Elysia marginata TaxID=1093978 RepID=A0AAV4G6M6_9GAST|nr:reverse transcriptase SR3-left [Elysia marginata]
MCANGWCCVGHGGHQGDLFAVKSGDRQDFIISLFLFLIAIDWVTKRATNQGPRGSHRRRSTIMGMILQMIWPCYLTKKKDMQEKAGCVEAAAGSVGLGIGHCGFRVMKTYTGSDSDALVDGESVENVADFGFLGGCLTADGGFGRKKIA